MSGKYMATDLNVERIWWDKDVFISFYLDIDTKEETEEIFAILVNKKYTMDEAIEMARKELDSKGLKDVPVCTCFKDRLGYNEEEGCYEKETWGETVTEVMWIINLS